MRERMKEEEPNWFSKWEEQLPPPEELTPLHQTLITPDLALAFNIRSPTPNFTTTTTSPYINHPHHPHSHHRRLTPPPPPPPPPTHPDFDNSSSAELTGNGSSGGGGAGSGGEEPARTLKRPRLVWTPQLHKRFVDAVAHLGIKNAVPKTIMQLMSVDGLTRENVASHLQKYRLYLKRMQGLNGNSGGGGGGAGTGSGDSATDHLFASSPVPPHFLHQSSVSGGGGPGSVGIVNGVTRGHNAEHFLPYVPPAMAAIHHQQMTAVAVTNGPHHPGNQSHYHGHHPHHHHHSKQIGAGQFGNGEQQLPFQSSSRQAQIGGMMMMMQSQAVGGGGGGYVEEIESGTVGVKNGREMLTLFPTGGD